VDNQNLYLVGTLHNDLNGKERLDTLLDRLAPFVIALEFHKDREELGSSQKSQEEEQRELTTLLDESGLNLNPGQRATLIESGQRVSSAMGYEFKSSRAYTTRNANSRLEYIDISLFANGREEFSKGLIESMSGVFKQIAADPKLAKQVLERLNGGVDAHLQYLRGDTQQIYQNAEAIAELFEMIRDPENFEMMKKTMSPQAIQALEQVYNPARDEAMKNRVRELYDGKNRLVAIVGLAHLQGLKTKLKDLKPRVMTLAEYDSV